MNKKNNLAFYALIIVGLFSLFAVNNFAQATDPAKIEQPAKQCSGEKFVMPQSVAVGNSAFEDYLKIASLPQDERRSLWSKQSNEQKANFIKVNLALQFVKRPEMTAEQKEFVLDAISMVSADLYDKTDAEKVSRARQSGTELENRAIGLFDRKDLGDFIEPLMMGKNAEIALLQKYENFLELPTMNERRKFFRQSSPLVRSELWKAQMSLYLATTPLTKIQQEFFVEVISLSTPRAFAFPTIEGEEKNNETKLFDNLEIKAKKLFSREEVFAFFESFGIHRVAPPNEDNPTSNSNLIPINDCNCNYFCWLGNCSGGSCRGTLDGCGWGGGTPCVFRCQILR